MKVAVSDVPLPTKVDVAVNGVPPNWRFNFPLLRKLPLGLSVAKWESVNAKGVCTAWLLPFHHNVKADT